MKPSKSMHRSRHHASRIIDSLTFGVELAENVLALRTAIRLWLWSMAVLPAMAELPSPRLLTIFPPGAKVGSTGEVHVAGVDLEDARAIYFSHPNITAVAQTNAGKFLVSVATNVPVGIYDARVIGRFGISNPRRFVVGELEETIEKSKDSVESAMEIAVGTTVNGHAEPNTARFGFPATNGQNIAIECQAAQIDSRMDPSLILYAPNGRELKQCRRGGGLEFVAAETGKYEIKVHDFLFGGGSEHFYRLSVKNQPRSDEPSHKVEEMELLKAPCEVVGQFYPAGDVDQYKFDVKKGEVWWVEVVSHRLGFPTDPLLLINDQEFNDIDANVGGQEFRTSSRDAVGRFEAKEDGACRIQVRDLFSRVVADPRNTYRLVVRKETPDFELVAMPQEPPAKKDSREVHIWSSVLRRGETILIKVIALRQDDFKGEISVQATDLPAGVASAELIIPSDKSSGTLLLSAAESATNWTGPISIVGKATVGTHKAKAATVIWNVPDYNNEPVRSRLADEFVLGVCDDAAPITIAAVDPKAYEVPAAGKLAIPLTVTRRGDFNEALKLKAYGVSALDSLKEIEVAEKGTNATIQLDLSQQKLTPGSYTFYLQGQTKGKYQDPVQKDKTKDVTFTVFSAPITLKVSPPQTAAK